MSTARIRGASCAYDLFGVGPAITLIHSIGLSTREGWRAQIAALAERHRVLTYDIRGLGASAAGSEPLGVDTFVEDLGVLLDHVGIQRTVLMGVSLGGFIAQAFALAYPERVGALVLVSTACRIAAGNTGARAERSVRIAAEGMAAVVGPQIDSHFSAAFRAANPDVMEWYRRHYLANDPGAYIAVMEDLGRFDTCARLGEIRCPTLVIAGGEDASSVAGSVPGQSARALAAGIADARLVVIDGAHHYPQIEKADAFNEAVLDFLAETEKDTP